MLNVGCLREGLQRKSFSRFLEGKDCSGKPDPERSEGTRPNKQYDILNINNKI